MWITSHVDLNNILSIDVIQFNVNRKKSFFMWISLWKSVDVTRNPPFDVVFFDVNTRAKKWGQSRGQPRNLRKSLQHRHLPGYIPDWVCSLVMCARSVGDFSKLFCRGNSSDTARTVSSSAICLRGASCCCAAVTLVNIVAEQCVTMDNQRFFLRMAILSLQSIQVLAFWWQQKNIDI